MKNLILFFFKFYIYKNWHSLDIYFDLNLKEINNFNNKDTIKKIKIINEFYIPFAFNYFKNSFKVRENNFININEIDKECEIIKPLIVKKGINKDLYLIIKFIDDKKIKFAGFTTICGKKKETNRPFISVIIINVFYLNLNENLVINSFRYILIHEIFHALGLNQESIPLFIDSNFNLVNVNNILLKYNDILYIKTKNLLKYAKKYFNCSKLKGIKWENNGAKESKDNHWELTQLGYDIMNSVVTTNSRISDFTFKYFEDSGWYKVNYNYSQILIWGANKGCEFLDKNFHSQFSEFCYNKKYVNCSEDYLLKSFCSYDNNAEGIINYYNRDYCNINLENNKSNENIKTFFYINHDSRCLLFKKFFNKTKSDCFKSFCINNGTSIIFQISPSETIQCSQEGKLIVNNITYECPNIKKFCELRYECKNSCSGNGICFNGNCICFYNFFGIACEYKYPEIINTNCKYNCYENGSCINNKCNCYDNYKGKYCENIINNIGSFGTNCIDSIYIKCYYKLNKNLLSNIYCKIIKIGLIILLFKLN